MARWVGLRGVRVRGAGRRQAAGCWSSDHCLDALLLAPMLCDSFAAGRSAPATSPKTVFSDMRLPRSLIRPPKPGQREG